MDQIKSYRDIKHVSVSDAVWSDTKTWRTSEWISSVCHACLRLNNVYETLTTLRTCVYLYHSGSEFISVYLHIESGNVLKWQNIFWLSDFFNDALLLTPVLWHKGDISFRFIIKTKLTLLINQMLQCISQVVGIYRLMMMIHGWTDTTLNRCHTEGSKQNLLIISQWVNETSSPHRCLRRMCALTRTNMSRLQTFLRLLTAHRAVLRKS